MLYDEEKVDYNIVANYFNWCKRFTKFSVEGSAYGIKIGCEQKDHDLGLEEVPEKDEGELNEENQDHKEEGEEDTLKI